MKGSIKRKNFLAIVVCVLVFIGLFAVLNLFFYDDYYYYEKQQMLIRSYETINAAYTGDVTAVSDTLTEQEYRYSERMVITRTDESGTQESLYTSFIKNGKLNNTEPMDAAGIKSPEYAGIPADGAQPDKMLQNGGKMDGMGPMHQVDDLLSGRFTYDEKELNEQGYTFAQLSGEFEQQNGFLALVGVLSNGDGIVIGLPISNLEESLRSNGFFMCAAGLLALLVSLILSYLVSRQFSKPLIEMNDIAKSMATLNFEKKYTGKNNDEIGQLGNSINQLSTYLQNAFGDLQDMNRQLAEEIEMRKKIDDMRQEFIINVSHELKTPIALVQGYAEGLKVNISSSEEDKNYYCDIIMDEAAHMNRLVMQLLNLSKIELGNVKPELTEIDIRAMAQQVTEKTKVLLDEGELKVDMDGLNAVCMGDYDMIEQVMTNYMTNAIHHTVQGGAIRLYSRESENDRVRIHVENEGSHIEEDELEKIWEKFYKLDKARTRSSGGTGIGLSIVKAIMQAHDGAYGAENTGFGVDFYFELKKAQ